MKTVSLPWYGIRYAPLAVRAFGSESAGSRIHHLQLPKLQTLLLPATIRILAPSCTIGLTSQEEEASGESNSASCAEIAGRGTMEDDATSSMEVDSPSEAVEAATSAQPPEFTASVKVDVPLLRFITGKRGQAKEKIEEETKTQLFVPLPHEVKKGSFLVIKGLSQEQVDAAVAQIQNVLQEATASPSLEYSHFISLPLALHSALIEQVENFQDSVLAMLPTEVSEAPSIYAETFGKDNDVMEEIPTSGEVDFNSHVETTKKNSTVMAEVDVAERDLKEQCTNDDEQSNENGTCKNDGDDIGEQLNDGAQLDEDKPGRPSKHCNGIEKSIFMRPGTLHLTVLMLKLWNEERVSAAAKVLQGVKSKVLEAVEGRPVAVRLSGIECMRGSPAKAHVLYAKVEEADRENRLIRACKVIIDAFSEAGLVLERDKKQELKLHATLMNTSHRKRKRGRRFGKRIPFDARQIMVKHGLEDWGEHSIVEAHLSERFVFGEDGYYRCCGAIQFPSALT